MRLRALDLVIAASVLALSAPASGQELADAVQVSDQIEYSYSSETEAEIVENWLDTSWLFGPVRAGFLLNHQAPAEEGTRRNELRHRFVEFTRGRTEVRAGHFYALFGRGLTLSSYEDRFIRVDTALDGIKVQHRGDRWRATALSGTPFERDVDLRGVDAEVDLPGGFLLGANAVTYRADDRITADGGIHREWIGAARASKWLSFGDVYAEYGWKEGWDAEVVPDDSFQNGHAFYAGMNMFAGGFGFSAELKDYERFTVVRNADGRTPLNKPPALTREHLYTLLARAAHALDADDEVGAQVEATWSGAEGWAALINVNRTEDESGRLLFEEAYVHIERDRWGPFFARAGFAYQDSDGLRQTAVGELTWRQDDRRAWTLKAEHQHVRLGEGPGFDLGAYDEQFVSLELALPPTWTFGLTAELNNKFEEQKDFAEKDSPFLAVATSWTSDRGDSLVLWAGRRQAGQLCSGGVCKFEPAFEGLEIAAVLRY